MDRFDLRWPSAEATFFTDGWRCRIVWRQSGGKRAAAGMGGTIENNAQCIRRVAASLDGAPYLLSALKARGHDRLANQIEVLAGEQSVLEPPQALAESPQAHAEPPQELEEMAAAGPKRAAPKPAAERRAERPSSARGGKAQSASAASSRAEAAANTTPRPRAAADPLAGWLAGLPGSDEFEAVANRRAKQWLEVGEHDAEAWALRVPAARGKQEWVLKRSWPDAKRKAEYVTAAHLKGIVRFMVSAGGEASSVEVLLAACKDVQQKELEAAAESWRTASGSIHQRSTH